MAWPHDRRAQLYGRSDGIVDPAPLLALAGDWGQFLAAGLRPEEHAAQQAAERTGRPLRDAAFVQKLERTLARRLTKRKPGPKPREAPAKTGN